MNNEDVSWNLCVVMERREALKFHTLSSLMIAGRSGCGKTVFTTKLLLDNPELFGDPAKNMCYCYRSWQDGFDTKT